MDVTSHPTPELRPLSSVTPDSSEPIAAEQSSFAARSSRDRWEASASFPAGAANESHPSWQMSRQHGRAQEAAATNAITHILTQRKQHEPRRRSEALQASRVKKTTKTNKTKRKNNGEHQHWQEAPRRLLKKKGKEKRKKRQHRPPSCTPPPSSSAGPPLASR